MIIEITKVKKLPWEFEISLPPEEIGLEPEEAELSQNVLISGSLSRRGEIFDLSGKLSANAVVYCTRCLEPIARLIEIQFTDSFGSPESFEGSADSELKADELYMSVLDGDEIDMGEVAREQILLNLPEQVFCREDCRGLCPTCGINLNRERCECAREATDPRWAALKNLK